MTAIDSSLAGRRVVVTGAAGFVGSTLCERLVRDGAHVVGVDSMDDYYPRATKLANVAALSSQPLFELLELDLAEDPLEDVLAGAHCVFHQAAQPGVRGSWGSQFHRYVRNNITVAQRLLEATVAWGVPHFVIASSSSVYGDAARHPTPEDAMLQPISPYGVTKAAAEHLALLYGRRHGLRVVALRYFTLYGPRQRPDMAFARFIAALDRGDPLPLYGDGGQTRDFTYVDDAVEANILAATNEAASGVFNIGGGSVWRLSDVIDLLGDVTGRPVRLDRRDAAPGDVRDTSARIERATEVLGYAPGVTLEDGLARQVAAARAALGVTLP